MRDPLSSLPIRYKLPLTFLLLFLLALTAGGYFVSRFAHQALQREITLRLETESESHARAIEAGCAVIARGVQDFASDGMIRDLLARIEDGDDPAGDTARLSRHLRVNKSPLVESFVDCSVWNREGRCVASSREARPRHHASAAAEALGHPGLWFGDFVEPNEHDAFPSFMIAAPLASVDNSRRLGVVLACIHVGRFIASTGVESPVTDDDTRLVLADRRGQELVVPSWLLHGAAGSSIQEEALGVAIRDADTARSGSRTFTRNLQRGGWAAHVEMPADAAMAPVRDLQSRYLGAGLVAMAVSLAAIFLSVRFIVVPLGRLRHAASRVARGELAARVDIESKDEIGDVGRSFNTMAAAIEARTAELEQKRDELGVVVAAMQDGLCLLDERGAVILSNEAAAPLLRVLSDAPLEIAARPPCEKRDRLDCAHCLKSSANRHCEVEVDGRIYEVIASELPAGSSIGGRLLVSRDITERLAMADRQAFHERMSVAGEVAGVVAHEINNPLASITMFNQMMADEIDDASPYREHVDVIARNAESCKRAIRDLLDNVRSAASEVAEIDARDVVDDAVRFLRPVARKAGIELTSELGADEAMVACDEVRLRQVFVNLALNAIQASDDDGHVHLAVAAANGHVHIDVEDDGPGIAAALRDRIFDPFFTTKPPNEGTGLGLPTARRSIEAHGGRLRLVRTDAAGTHFRVELPGVAESVKGA